MKNDSKHNTVEEITDGVWTNTKGLGEGFSR